MTASMTMTGCSRNTVKAGRTVWHRGPGLLVAVLLLTGCPGSTMPPDHGSLRTGQTALPNRTAAVQAPRPATKPTVSNSAATGPVAPSAATSAAATNATVPEVPAPSTPGIALASAGNVEPDALVGLDQGQTRRLLGSPTATEEEAPARVWRYADNACTLKVFFFMDMTSQDFRALSYDMKSSDNVRDADDRCFARLLAQAWDDARDER